MEVAGLAREHDQTLVRHLYDLHFLRHTMQDIRFGTLVAQVMNQDAQAFGNQYPAYRDDHIGQTQAAMDALAENPVYAQRYADFVGAMVYGEVPPFIDCIATLREFLLVVNSNTAPL